MSRGRILEGLRIVELGQLIAVPYATKLLADMGAEVIRIESANRPDIYRLSDYYDERIDGEYWNRAINFNEQNRNKRSFCVELDKNEGNDALLELISISDVFASNFTPRVMKKYGLEYQDLIKIKPDIIVVSSTGYGHSGPWSSFGAIGFGTEAASGLSSTTGYRGEGPSQPEIPYPDYTAAEHTVYGILSALLYRMETGKGQFLNVSQSECVTSTIPEAILDFTANEVVVKRIGNDNAEIPLHGCFPCKGFDDWVAIVVDSNSEWEMLISVMFSEGHDPKFDKYDYRDLNREELHQLISSKTIEYDKIVLMKMLQERGIRAGAVLNGEELLFNEHLKHRQFFELLDHDTSTGIPALPYPSRPWKMNISMDLKNSPPPTLGHDNRFVSIDLLGHSDKHYNYLTNNQILARKLDIPSKKPDTNRAQRNQNQEIHKYDPDFKARIQKEFMVNE